MFGHNEAIRRRLTVTTNKCIEEIEVSKGSLTIVKGFKTLTGLENEPNIEALVSEGKLDAKKAEQIKEEFTNMRAWILEDESRLARFKADPITVLQERFGNLLDKLPKKWIYGLEDDFDKEACAKVPPPTIYSECVIAILRRLATWIRLSPANRESYIKTPDAAVDTVARSAPVIAVALAKNAIHRSRTILGQGS